MADPPPAKRLKLKGPRPLSSHSNDSTGDSVAVSRPKRSSTQKMKSYADEAQGGEDSAGEAGSYLSSDPSSPRELPAPAKSRKSAADEYGDFMSYYITADPNDKHSEKGDEAAIVEPEGISLPTEGIEAASLPMPKRRGRPRKSAAVTQHERPPEPLRDSPQAPPVGSGRPRDSTRISRSDTKSVVRQASPQLPKSGRVKSKKSHSVIQSDSLRPARQEQKQSSATGLRAMGPAPIAQLPVRPPRPTQDPSHRPMVQPYRPPPIPRPDPPPAPMTMPKVLATVNEMVRLLRDLSDSLLPFGDVPAVTKPSGDDDTRRRAQGRSSKPQQSKLQKVHKVANPLDSFLSTIEGDGSDSGDEVDLKQRRVGEYDQALAFGIMFICNALRSWASQRIQNEHVAAMNDYNQRIAQIETNVKRGPGRPRKDGQRSAIESAPILKLDESGQYDLKGTPEGRAIDAFYAVLHSGALQVNAVMPTALSRALTTLYVQIDHLINQHPRPEKPHAYMSYWVQIETNEQNVAQQKAQSAQAHQLFILTQAESDQRIRHAMGMNPMSATPTQQLEEAERQRQRQLAGTAPMSQPSTFSTLPHSKQYSRVPSSSLTASQSPKPTGAIQMPIGPLGQAARRGGPISLDKVQAYSHDPTAQSLNSGYKFSFRPQSGDAVRAFGPQAFPPNTHSPITHLVPNVGPVNGKVASNSPVHGHPLGALPALNSALINGNAPPKIVSTIKSTKKSTGPLVHTNSAANPITIPSSPVMGNASGTAKVPPTYAYSKTVDDDAAARIRAADEAFLEGIEMPSRKHISNGRSVEPPTRRRSSAVPSQRASRLSSALSAATNDGTNRGDSSVIDPSQHSSNGSASVMNHDSPPMRASPSWKPSRRSSGANTLMSIVPSDGTRRQSRHFSDASVSSTGAVHTGKRLKLNVKKRQSEVVEID